MVDLFPVQLGKKDERQRPVHLVGSVREDIADANSQTIFMQPGGVIQPGERKELDTDFRERGSRAKFAMRYCKDGADLRHHCSLRFFSVFGTIFSASLASADA